MRTLIVDDHALFSEGLRLLLTASTPIGDVTCCTSGEEALRLAAERPFDLVLLDWNLGRALHGAALIEQLRAVLPGARLVVVSGESSAAHVRAAIDAGAVGFVPKESPSALLVDALTITAHGGIYLPLAALQADQNAPPATPPPASGLRGIAEAYPELTAREVEVLERVARGLANKQIARELDIAEGTVKQHLNAIYQELAVHNRTEAVYLLAKSGVRIA
jgi:two-component system nitrate/nitrite response regulator NarL